mgnify:CR=1 FL=1
MEDACDAASTVSFLTELELAARCGAVVQAAVDLVRCAVGLDHRGAYPAVWGNGPGDEDQGVVLRWASDAGDVRVVVRSDGLTAEMGSEQDGSDAWYVDAWTAEELVADPRVASAIREAASGRQDPRVTFAGSSAASRFARWVERGPTAGTLR